MSRILNENDSFVCLENIYKNAIKQRIKVNDIEVQVNPYCVNLSAVVLPSPRLRRRRTEKKLDTPELHEDGARASK